MPKKEQIEMEHVRSVAGMVSVVVSLPAAVVRELINVPKTLVNAMEKFAAK